MPQLCRPPIASAGTATVTAIGLASVQALNPSRLSQSGEDPGGYATRYSSAVSNDATRKDGAGSAAAAGAAAASAASAARSAGLAAGGQAAHRHGGQQLHRVIVALRAGARS